MGVLIHTLLYLVFAVLVVFGTALAVAWLFALLDPIPAAPPGVSAGRVRQLRRYSACWAAGLCAWAAGVALLSLLHAGA